MSSSSPTEVSYKEFYEFRVKQAFWGGIDMKFDDCENSLVFQLVLTDGNPILSIRFTFNSNDGTPLNNFEVKSEEISQIIFTPVKLINRAPCVLVLRLTEATYNLIKSTLPQKFSEWKDQMRRGEVHCTTFSDNLIFVIDPSNIIYRQNEDIILFKTWAMDIVEIIDHIESQWQSYLEYTLKWKSKDCEDLLVPLTKRNVKNFKKSFGLNRGRIFVQGENEFDYRGFKIIPMEHGEEVEKATDTSKNGIERNGSEGDDESENKNDEEGEDNEEQKNEPIFGDECVPPKKAVKYGDSEDLDYEEY